MDFGFTEEQEKLRKEVHEFFLDELPADYHSRFFGIYALRDELASSSLELQRKVGEKGWLTPSWPKEYGGLGLGDIERGVITEEVVRWAALWPNYVGSDIAGPALLSFASEEQKERFLPPIAQGKVQWDQLFTEPDAGSDEANIQLRAVADGDSFIFNGQKTFVGEIYDPDYLYTMARTADTTPKHRGLTLFLIPADTPGVTDRPMPMISGQLKREFFFDDVRIPKEYMLGELNRGFYHAMASLQIERAFLGSPAGDREELEEFVQFCKDTKRNGKRLIDDPQVRDALARIAVELEVCRLASWRTVWRVSQQEKLGPLDYDLSGLYHKVFDAPHCEAMMNIMGLYSQLRVSSKWAQIDGVLERRWQTSRSLHIGGTVEILKVVLAQRGLGLPRRR